MNRNAMVIDAVEFRQYVADKKQCQRNLMEESLREWKENVLPRIVENERRQEEAKQRQSEYTRKVKTFDRVAIPAVISLVVLGLIFISLI